MRDSKWNSFYKRPDCSTQSKCFLSLFEFNKMTDYLSCTIALHYPWKSMPGWEILPFAKGGSQRGYTTDTRQVLFSCAGYWLATDEKVITRWVITSWFCVSLVTFLGLHKGYPKGSIPKNTDCVQREAWGSISVISPKKKGWFLLFFYCPVAIWSSLSC